MSRLEQVAGANGRDEIEALTALARKALAHWRLTKAELWLLKHRENAVFGVRDDGRQWVLRIHRAGYHSDRAVESELLWMQALGQAGIAVPCPISTCAGGVLAHVSHPGVSAPRQCDLLSWVAGTPIGTIEGAGAPSSAEVERDHHQAGRLSAAIHNQSEYWQAPANFERPRMDAEGLVGAGGYLGHYRDLCALGRRGRALLDRASLAVRQRLERFGYGADRFGLVHGDFLPENLLRDGDEVRIIDFDDCGFGWHLMDMATALFFLLGEPSFDPACRGFVAGYRSVRPLPAEHLDMLPTLLLARGITYLGWCATRQETAAAQDLGPVVTAAVLEMARDYLES